MNASLPLIARLNYFNFDLINFLAGLPLTTNPTSDSQCISFFHPLENKRIREKKVLYEVIINVVDLDTEECVHKKSITNIEIFVSLIRLICFYKSHSIIMEMTEKNLLESRYIVLCGVVGCSSPPWQCFFCNIIQLFISISYPYNFRSIVESIDFFSVLLRGFWEN